MFRVLLIAVLVACVNAQVWRLPLSLNSPYRVAPTQWLLPGQRGQFELSVPASEVADVNQYVKIAVTSLGSEEPTVYADFRQATPSSVARYYRSPKSKAEGGMPVMFVHNTDFPAYSQQTAPYTLWITVECTAVAETACYFTVAASANAKTVLWPGFQLGDKAKKGSVNYYEFKPQWFSNVTYPTGTTVATTTANNDIQITLVPVRGRVSVYVLAGSFAQNTRPSRTNFNRQWSVADYNNEVILIERGAPGRGSNSFVIAVFADSTETVEEEEVSYYIQGTFRAHGQGQTSNISSTECRWLTPDVPVPSQALEGGGDDEWEQLCFVHMGNDCSFDLSLTVISGEQDFLLWYDGEVREIGAGLGSDNVHLTPSGMKFYALIVLTADYGQYNVLYTKSCPAQNRLMAVSQSANQSNNSVFVQIERDMALAQTAVESTVVSRLSQFKAETALLRSKEIGAQSPMMISDSFDSETEAVAFSKSKEFIQKDDQAHKFHTLSTNKTSLKLGYVPPMSFHAIQLTQGQAQYGEATEFQLIRFVYHPYTYNDDFTFELIRNIGGNPDIYVSTSNANTLPTNLNAQWRSNEVGSDYITVDKYDDYACVRRGCYYNIAVYIASQPSQYPVTGYTLIASEGEAHTNLQNNVPYSNKLVAGEPDYLRFVVANPGQTITIRLSDTGRAQPRMYVSTIYKFPNATFSEWTRVVSSTGSSVELVITSESVNYCLPTRVEPCIYWIGVTSGNTQNTTYTILASAGGAIELRHGVYQTGSVRAGTMQQYFFQVTTGYKRFATQLTTLSGQASFYVGNTVAPVRGSPSTYVASRNSTALKNPIIISETDTIRCTLVSGKCRYFIGVYGENGGDDGTVRFAIQGFTGERVSLGVQNGMPIVINLQPNETHYYYAPLLDETQRAQICLTVISGFVDGYFSDVDDNAFPDSTNYKQRWVVRRAGYGCISSGAAHRGQWYWSVTNPSMNSTSLVSIMFLSQIGNNDRSAVVQLLDGTPSAMYFNGYGCEGNPCESYSPNPLIYFNFPVDRTVASLEFTLFKLLGETDMFINYIAPNAQTRWPNTTHHDYAGAGSGSDVIRVPNARAGRFLGVAVQSPDISTGSAAMLTASTGITAYMLQNGVTVRGFATHQAMRFYQLVITDPYASIFIDLVAEDGDPDIYANPGTSLSFTRDTAAWVSAAYGGDSYTIQRDDPKRPTSATWTLTIGIYSFSGDSSFSLTATMQSNYFLRAGEPMSGTVAAGEYHYYAMRPSDLSSRIDVMLQPLSGWPRMIISNNWPTPTTNNYTYDWAASGTNPFYIEMDPATNSPDRSYMCSARGISLANCVYYIGVFGYLSRPASYLIRFDQPGTGIDLPDKTLLTGTLPARSTAYYRFNNRELDSTVAFLVTPLTGEADMWVSATTNRPGPTNYTWKSDYEGFDVVGIRPATDLYYYIAVNNPSSSRTDYTIIGKSYDESRPGDGADTLVEGVPQNGFTTRGAYSYYQFYVSGVWSSLTITVTPLLGDPDIFVNGPTKSWPNNTYSDERSTGTGIDRVTIHNPPVGYQYISILSHTASSDHSYYRIVVTGEGRSTQMFSGTLYSKTVTAGNSDYYYLTVGSIVTNASLVFSVTPETGDPDIYVSDVYRYPNATNCNWTAASSSVDVISIPADQLRSGNYYVAVKAYGSSNASYHLMGRYGTRASLIDGVAVSDVVRRGSFNYFDVWMPSAVQFIVSLNTLTTSNTYTYLYVTSGSRDPTPSSYEWISNNAQSKRQEVRISNPKTCADNNCHYRVAVAAPLEVDVLSTSFVIIAQSNRSVSNLEPNVPRTDVVPKGGYMHYRFDLTCAQSAVSITLTPQSGNADLLVNRGPFFPLRSLKNIMFESNNTGTGVDRVQFDWNHPLVRGTNMAGSWYISVINEASVAVTYSIVFSSTNGNCQWTESSSTGAPGPSRSSSTGVAPGSSGGSGTGGAPSSTGTGPIPGFIGLTENVPVTGEIVRGAYAYYSFTLPSLSAKPWPYTVYFTLVPLLETSDPDIFVRKDLGVPSRENSQWRSISASGRDDMIAITPTSTPYGPCNPTMNGTCTYTIAVYAAGVSSDVTDKFSIVASTSTALYGLELDHTLASRSIASQSWYYYVVDVQNPQLPLVAIVTPLSGNPDLYVQYGRLPTFDSPTSKTFGVDIVTVNPTFRGLYYIGVYGEHTASSTYTIVASQSGIELSGGQPQGDVLSMGQQRFYYYDFKATVAENAAFNLQLDAIAFNPLLDIYVRSDNQPLSPTSYQWVISSGATWPLSLTVPRGAVGYVYTGRYRILVVSRSDSAAFAITASKGGATPVTLTNGRPVDSGADAIPSNAFRYYRVYVSNTERELVWSLSMSQGSASLFLSPDVGLPGPGASKYSNSTLNGNSVVIRVPSRELRVGWYYASVRADWTSIRYTIAASTGSTLLQVGDSQHIQCAAGTSDYVLYLPWKTGSAAETITFYATPNDWPSQTYTGNVNMYITTDPSILEPGPTTAQWTASKFNWVSPFTIGKWDTNLQSCIAAGNCQLNIAISCPASARAVTILLNVEVGASLMPLLPSSVGAFAQAWDLDTTMERHYTSAVSKGPFAEVVLETCKGQTGLYVNYARSTIPTVGNADLADAKTDTLHHVTVSQPLADKRMFITVRGMSNELASYKLYSIVNNTWADSSPRVGGDIKVEITAPSLTRYQRIIATVEKASEPEVVRTRRIPIPSGFIGQMRYDLYYTIDGDTTESATLYTECGLQRSATHYKTFTDREMNLLGYRMTMLVPDVKARYSITVVASYWFVRMNGNNIAEQRRATAGFFVYTTASKVRPGTGGDIPPEPEVESSTAAAPEAATSVTWKIMLAFACVLAVVFAAVGYHYYKKNKNSVPVNNILGLDTDFSAEEGMKMRSLLDNEVDSSATSNQDGRGSPKQTGPAPL